MNTLRVDCCGLTSQVVAQGKEFVEALKGNDFLNLTVSKNMSVIKLLPK